MTRDEKIQAIDASYHAGESLQAILAKVGSDDDTLRLIHLRLGTAMSILRRLRDES